MQGPELGDYIGVESCVDLSPVAAAADYHTSPHLTGTSLSTRGRRWVPAAKEYPPPIPAAAHFPWVMKRYCTGDGRLVIREERLKRHEYFEASRSDGRLVINLVAVSDGGEDDEEKLLESPQEVNNAVEGEIDGGDERATSDPTVEENVVERCKYGGGGNAYGGFGVEVAAIRPPVQT